MSKQTDLINIPDAITVDGSNVGINKQSPAVPLDVTGTLQASGRFLTASGSVTSGYQFSGDGDTGMYQSSVNNINFSTANAHRITIGSTGKVGIGDTATNPVSRLEVRDLNDSGAFVGATITNVSSNNAISGVAFKAYDWVQSGIYHHRGTSSASALTLATNPNTSDLSVGGLVPRLNIDNAGRVTMPYQPAFRAGRSGNYIAGVGNNILFNLTSGTQLFNTGSHYSTTTGLFTAPVTGSYIFHAVVIWGPSMPEGEDMADSFRFNYNNTRFHYSEKRAEYVSGTTGNGGYYVDHATCIARMNTNDTLGVYSQEAQTVHGNAQYTTFTGHLLS